MKAIGKKFREVLEGNLTSLWRKFELVGLTVKRNGIENGIGASVSLVSAQQIFLSCHQPEESML